MCFYKWRRFQPCQSVDSGHGMFLHNIYRSRMCMQEQQVMSRSLHGVLAGAQGIRRALSTTCMAATTNIADFSRHFSCTLRHLAVQGTLVI